MGTRNTLTARACAAFVLAALLGAPAFTRAIAADATAQASPAAAAPLTPPQAAQLKLQVHRALMTEGRAEMREQCEWARRLAHAKRHRAAQGRNSAERPHGDLAPAGPVPAALRASSAARATGIQSALAPNVLVSDTTGDQASDSGGGEGEPGIAAWHHFVLASWNDGQGFVTIPESDLLSYGWSKDGGLTFTRGRPVPRPNTMKWTSDPVVTVNEKTGYFYVTGLVQVGAGASGVALARAHFDVNDQIQWDPAVVVVQSSTDFLDKPWVVADSLSGRVYLSFTRFYASGDSSLDRIDFVRTTSDPAAASWTPTFSAPLEVSSPSARGWVQGSRPAVGPDGEVYVTWKEIGPTDADFIRIRKSVNQGTSFGAEALAAAIYDNFGTGAPGFNRERAITFPAIAVDRGTGTNRGRVYIAWNGTFNWYTDLGIGGPLGNLGPKVEVEPNPTRAQATPFSIGNILRGNFNLIGDKDYYKFAAVQGETYTFVCDSIPDPLYTMRIICSQDSTRLNYTGDLALPAGDAYGVLVWTCPQNGTYFLRMFSDPNISTDGGGSPGGYRIWTGRNTGANALARDQREVLVASSANGTVYGTPVRVNSDAPYFDNWLPEVAVTPAGQVYALWYGFFDAAAATCGGEANTYLSRSPDGGATWIDVGRASEVSSNWSAGYTNITPNQGDYLGLFANDVDVYAAWADNRFGNADLFSVSLPLSITPTLVSLASADAQPDHVTLHWYSGSPDIGSAYVYRDEGGEWMLKSVIARDGTGDLSYVDRDVYPGVTYRYRLGVRQGTSETYMGEVTVIVPSLNRLRIESVRPNPADREVWVSFTLPQAAPAKLQLIDVAGRVVREHEVGVLGTGKHLMDLAGGTRLPTGVYLVRLEQGGKALTARVSVVR